MRTSINLLTTGILTWHYKRKDAHLYAEIGDDHQVKAEKAPEKLEESKMTKKEKRQSEGDGRVLKYGRAAPTEIVKKDEKKKKFKF